MNPRNVRRALGASNAAMQTRRRLLHRVWQSNNRPLMMSHHNRLGMTPVAHLFQKAPPTLFLEYLEPLGEALDSDSVTEEKSEGMGE